MEVNTQTDECQEATTTDVKQKRRHEAEVKALTLELDHLRRFNVGLTRQLEDACTQSEQCRVLVKSFEQAEVILLKRLSEAENRKSCRGTTRHLTSGDWTCDHCGYVTYGSGKTHKCINCNTVRRSGKR